ncbi:amino acid deaminase [Occallatibacter riparius]|uniref:Amino acid deaminase n=1 Tax=Occallatibacter riparius TaxID=1002689 RepID=A0A9J7BT85_9BACT|nr:amino acid deaminase [Occallatibacter riparius]UWZ85801.1 amino acid deaminase [Occallatibacter riparius]
MPPQDPRFDTISPLNKGLGPMDHALRATDIPSLNWNLLREDLSLPSAVLYRDKLLHNQQWMRHFIDAYGVKLAPHGKTTMAPQLFQLQLDGGAWGITLATAHQTLVAHAHGVRRVLMANQLIGRPNMAIIANLLRDPAFEFYCLVDSADQVNQLGEYFRSQSQQLNVLIELGVPNGRAGVRDEQQLLSVLTALDRWPDAVRLCGIEVYEGVLDNEPAIRQFLQRACSVTNQLIAEKRFAQKPILTGAGSAWFDIVAEEFTAARFSAPVEIVLRPGCYLTHDVGSYRRAHQRMRQNNPVAHQMNTTLETALHIWAYVQSIPEPTRAIIGMGRRDAAFDSGLPVPALQYRPSANAAANAPSATPAHWTITKLMDQHAYLEIAPGDDLHIGDMLAFDICHPCLTFDKWRTLPILDANYNVVDLVQTFF